MIATLWAYSDWLWAALAFVPYLGKLSFVVRMLSVLGPFAPFVQLALEKAAEGLTLLATYALKVAWFLLFHPITWSGLLTCYLLGSCFPVQNIEPPRFKKRPAIVQHAAPRKTGKRTADTRSVTRQQFER